MPTDTASPVSTVPSRDPVPDLIDRAASGEALTVGESGDLLDYYLTNKGLPGRGKSKALTVELGHGDEVRSFSCSIRPVEWSAWQDSIERGTSKGGDFDRFIAASWCVARALVTPVLGPAVVAMQRDAKASPDGKIDGPGGERISPPSDAAHLLRRMFAEQSGALLELNAEILKISRLANDSQSVREVDAGKD